MLLDTFNIMTISYIQLAEQALVKYSCKPMANYMKETHKVETIRIKKFNKPCSLF